MNLLRIGNVVVNLDQVTDAHFEPEARRVRIYLSGIAEDMMYEGPLGAIVWEKLCERCLCSVDVTPKGVM